MEVFRIASKDTQSSAGPFLTLVDKISYFSDLRFNNLSELNYFGQELVSHLLIGSYISQLLKVNLVFHKQS
jgi:hypothetical protein